MCFLIDYMEVVAAESEDLGGGIDSGTALSIELASTASCAAPMLLAARRRRQQLSLDEANLKGNSSQAKIRKRTNLNAFGDSEDEAEEDDEENDEDENMVGREAAFVGGTASDLRYPLVAAATAAMNGNIPMDLYRLRQLQRAKR